MCSLILGRFLFVPWLLVAPLLGLPLEESAMGAYFRAPLSAAQRDFPRERDGARAYRGSVVAPDLPCDGPGMLAELVAAATQLATATATPRLLLATETPPVSPAAAHTAAATSVEPPSAASSPPSATPQRGAVSRPFGDGALAGSGRPTPAVASAAAPAAGSLSPQGAAGGATTAAGQEVPQGGALGGERGAAIAGAQAEHTTLARSRWVPLPTDDPVVRRMWLEYGSPWGGATMAERLTWARPAPWGWLGGYVLAVALLVAASWLVWRGLRPEPTERGATAEWSADERSAPTVGHGGDSG